MLELVQTPLARRMWRISKFFRIPLSDPRIQALTPYDLEFYELSMIADDPEKLSQLDNHFYDPDFDEWVDEFEAEQAEEAAKVKSEEVSTDTANSALPEESWDEYDISESTSLFDKDDWEEVTD